MRDKLTRLDYEKLKMDFDFLENKNKELEENQNKIKNQFEKLLQLLLNYGVLKSWHYNGGFNYEFAEDTTTNYYKKLYEETREELERGRKRWAYYEARFVSCSTCDTEKKEKCLMFNENLCEGERCETLIDLEDLLNKAVDNGRI